MQVYLIRILRLAKLFKIDHSRQLVEASEAGLRLCFAELLAQHKYEDAYLIADSCSDLEDDEKSYSLLQGLLGVSEVPALIRAKVICLVIQAKSHQDVDGSTDELKNQARNIFVESGHAYGALEIDFNEACKSLKSDVGLVNDHWNTIQQFLRLLEGLDYQKKISAAALEVEASIEHLMTLDIRFQVVRDQEELSRKTGGRIFLILRQIGTMATWQRQTGHMSKSIEGGKAMVDELQSSDCAWLKGFAAQNLCHAYMSLHDYDQALEWAKKCFGHWEGLDISDKSEARKEILNARVSGRVLSGEDSLRIMENTWSHVQEELSAGTFVSAIEKVEIILTMILMRHRELHESRWVDIFEALIGKLPEQIADSKRASLYQIKADFALVDGQQRTDVAKENEAIGYFEEAIPLYLSQRQMFHAANTRQKCALTHWSIFKKLRTVESFQKSLTQYEIAGDYFRLTDHTAQIELNTYSIARCCYEGWLYGLFDASTTLGTLFSAEAVRDQQRAELTILGGLEAIARKQRLRTDASLRHIYEMVFTICIQDNRPEELWEWIQRAKARSLSDALGLGILVPEGLEMQIQADPETKKLYEEEQKLLESIGSASNNERISLRTDLWTLQTKMRTYTPLKKLINLREGQSTDLEKMKMVLSTSRETLPNMKLVFVDWFIKGNSIYVCTLRDQGPPEFKQCDIEYKNVLDWKNTYLDTKEGISRSLQADDDEESPLRELDPLVAPLKDIAREGDAFVLSLTAPLHAIPVHALWIDEDPMIEQHPVIYAASLTSFAQCWDLAASREWNPDSRIALAFFEEPSLLCERNEIYQFMEELCQDLGSMKFVGEEASRATFASSLQNACQVHFHGHGSLNKMAMTDQVLALADGEFSVRNIFDIKTNALLVTLIACDSASQVIATGDEPLGIVSALLCAGASSVLGTIWPTASGSGRKFSRLFYDNMKANALDGSIINLAVALQRAVKAIKRDSETRAPYYWASFVLHGASHFRLSKK
jgi:CHAT domain-containing protein